MVMELSRTHDFRTKGPAPTGLDAKPLPLACMAVGEPMAARLRAMARGNCPNGAVSVILSVRGSTTSSALITDAAPRFGDPVAGSRIRCQLNFTALASYGVPSVKL